MCRPLVWCAPVGLGRIAGALFVCCPYRWACGCNLFCGVFKRPPVRALTRGSGSLVPGASLHPCRFAVVGLFVALLFTLTLYYD